MMREPNMTRLLLVLMFCGKLLAVATAQDKPTPPTAQQPEIMIAKAAQGEDGVVVSFSSPILKPRSERVEAEVDGKKISMTRMVYDFVKWYETDLKVDGKTIKVYGVDGKEVEAAALPERLKKPTRVAVMLHSPDVKVKLDSYYLEALREDTLVFTIPLPTYYAAAQP